MAFTIENRPFGFNRTVLYTTAPTELIQNNVGSSLVSLGNNHNLNTGNVVYMVSPIDTHNGFKYVEVLSASQFYLKNSPNGSRIPFIKTVTGPDFFFWSALNNTQVAGVHEWNCIHLPIKYEISNTLWPTNSADTVRTISTVTNSNGYCALTLSGDIKATGSAAVLEFIKITNSDGGGAFPAYDGVYQIIAYTNDTTFTISLGYDNTVDLSVTNASIQYYYNNYHLKVKIIGGMRDGHLYEGQKPYAEVAVIDQMPDEDNLCVFSVNEILMSLVNTRNNLLLGTLPNVFDFFANFYIEVAEVYDDSDGTTLAPITPVYTSDIENFEGTAVNAKLPFKNVHSGSLSQYVGNDSERKLLTLFDNPAIFSGQYFDISFMSQYFQSFPYPALSTYTNEGSGIDWTLGALPSITLADGESSKLLTGLAPRRLKAGVTYKVAYRVSYVGASATTFNVGFGTTPTEFANTVSVGLINGDNLGVLTVAPTNDTYINFRVIDVVGGGGGLYTFLDYWIYPVSSRYFNEITLRQEYYLNGALQSTTDIEVFNADEGVYRQQLTDPVCTSDEVKVTLYRKELNLLALPSTWSNFSAGTAFDTKGFSSFTEAVTTVSVSPAIAFTTLTTAIGEVVRITMPIDVSGGATFTTGIRVNTFLADGAGTPTSDIDSITITADGVYSLEAELVATGAGARIYVQCIRDGISAGTATTVITIPETFTIQKTGVISETKDITIVCDCLKSKATGYYLSWFTYLSGFDYWYFTSYADNEIDIVETEETEENIFDEWPYSYGEFSDTIRKNTFRKSREQVRLRSGTLTRNQFFGLKHIKTSPVVQIVNSIYDRRTVIVDRDSFTYFKEGEDSYTIEFTISYTDDVPSQTV